MSRPSSKELFRFAAIYLATAFLFSFLSFLHMQPPVVIAEYARPALIFEIGGHIVFGLLAAIPFLDLELIILTGLLCILIDIDHFQIALGFQLSGNPDHSIFFALVSALVLASVSPPRLKIELFAAGFVVLFAHVAFDVFAGWNLFQLLIPLNFKVFTLPKTSWFTLELGAITIAIAATLLTRRLRNS
ncbi:MAG: hypothetical protein ACHQ1H_10495 [Nitrososphaerales archaeon]